MKTKSILTSLLLAGATFLASAGVTLPYVNGCEDLSTVATTPNGSRNWTCVGKQEFRVQRVNNNTPYTGAVFFPEVDFVAGKTYRIDVTARHNQRADVGSYKVWLAKGTTNSSFVSPAVAVESQLKGWYYTKRSHYYTPSTSGTYRVAVQATSPGTCDYFFITEFAISECATSLPGAPTGVSVTPDASGLKSAKVSVTAPAVNVAGEPLTVPMSSLDIYWGDNLMGSIPSPRPGQSYDTTIEVGHARPYIFTLAASTAEGRGATTHAEAAIGQDLPSWTTVTDYKGGGMRHSYRAVYVPGEGVKLHFDSTLAGAARGSYVVTRRPDNVLITPASGGDTPDVTDRNYPLTSRLSYYYDVAYTDTLGQDKTVSSTVVSLNNPVAYYVDFSDRSVASDRTYVEFTQDDAGRDGNCFGANQNGYMSCYNRNDWLITPGVKLSAGKYYRFKAGLGSSGIAPVGAEIGMGPGNDVGSLTDKVMPLTMIKTDGKPGCFNSYFTVDADGNYFFGIRSINYNEEKSYNSLLVYSLGVEEVEEDLPGPCTALKATFSSATNGTFSFTASPLNIAGKVQKSLERVVVECDGVAIDTVTNPKPGETYSVPITVENGKSYIYRVVPFNDKGEGTPAELLVSLITPPYENKFTSPNALDGFTIVDGHNDGFTWHIYAGEARCYPGENGADDHLITAPLSLEEGMWYKVQFDTHNVSSYPDHDNTLSLLLGDRPAVEALTDTLIAPVTVPETGKVTLKEYFTVDKSGQYYLGWRSYNPSRYATPVFLNNFTLSAPIKGTVPGAGKLVVTPDATGLLKANVNVTLPTTDLAGNQLGSLTRADLYIDGVLFKNFTVSAGDASFDVAIDKLSEGPHHFLLYCRNGDGQGRECEVDAYIGINRPGAPRNLMVSRTANEGEVTISWEAPAEDYDGYPINPDWISYDVFVYNSAAETQEELETVVKASTKDLAFTYQALQPDDPQQFIRYGVRAYTSKGGSQGVLAQSIPVGTPDKVPYTESFVNLRPRNIFRHVNVSTNNLATWGSNDEEPSGVYPYDNDRGLALMQSYWTGGSAALGSGRIFLDCDHPLLSLFLYDYSTPSLRDDNLFGIYVRPDGGDWTKVAEKSVSGWSDNTPGWQKIAVDLSEYARKNVEIAFRGESATHTFVVMDRISVRQAQATDMTMGGVTMGAEAFIGRDIPVSVSVKNNGTDDARSKRVSLYRNGELLTGCDIDLDAGKRLNIMFNDTISLAMARQSMDYVYTARVDAAGENEANAYDNTSAEISLPLVDNSDYPTVSSLSGRQNENTVELSWDAPIVPGSPETVTDNLEDYRSWATQATGMGGYRFYDNDKLGVLGWEDVQWPIEYQSFQSFFLADFSDPSLAAIRSQVPGLFEAHSGNKALMSLSPADPQAYVSDMIVSPLLGGGSQHLTFWAKAFSDAYPESFEVKYSTTDNEYGSFKSLGYVTNVPGTWTEYSCNIPAGARYFAIERSNMGRVCLFIDDLTYAPAGNERLVVEGYNIYRGGMKISHAFSPAETMSFIDREVPAGDNDYDVSVLYNRGESPAVSTSVAYSALERMLAGDIAVTGGHGCVNVAGAEGLVVNIYTPDGVLVKSVKAVHDMAIPVGAGFYVVTVGTVTCKVAVS